MEIDEAGDLIYYTYYMVDWDKVKQVPSGEVCVSCRGKMYHIETIRDKKGRAYEGTVCHSCKTVLWVKTLATD